jgi:glycosyltransferase involved in cell wall biosynthesis
MIVKNEAELLAACLNSVVDIVDQIVIVDTGSRDNTIDIAKDFKAEIYYHAWQNHFAKARNESIRHATGDWILWMDADEKLLPESRSKLVKLLEPVQKPIAYNIQIHNLQKDKKTIIVSDGHRLFTNNMGIQFSGRIHEQISPSINKLGGEIRDSEINIFHRGYSYTGKKEKQKNERNRQLLQKMVEEEPDNAYAHYTLGQFYGLNKNHDRAISHYQKAFRLDQLPSPMQASLLNVMAEESLKTDQLQKAKKYANKSIDLVELQVGGFYILYKTAQIENQNNIAIQHLQTIFTNCKIIKKTKKRISSDVLIEEDKILYTIGSLYLCEDELQSAHQFFTKAFKANDSNKNAYKKLLHLNIVLGNRREFLNLIENNNLFIQQDLEFLNNLGISLIKKKYFKCAISVYNQIKKIDPKNVMAIKRIAGLYAKIGAQQKAQKQVFQLQNIIKHK